MASGSVEGSRKNHKLKDEVYRRNSLKGPKPNLTMPRTEIPASEEAYSSQKRRLSHFGVALGEFLSENGSHGGVKSGLEKHVTIKLASKSKKEVLEIQRKLQVELNLVRNWLRKIEVNAGSDVDNVDGQKGVSRPLDQLSVSVLENGQGVSDNVEKEKRSPRVNQFCPNTDSLIGKDMFPPVDKKSKSNWKKQGGGEVKFSNQLLKSCNSLLERLMKHKHGWVFNKPVDVKALGLHDYFVIIKHPMDLGTVKSKLSDNLYVSPREFAEDVRLTFHNAMTYNPKGQDVYLMADQLLQIFEEKWAVIEADYLRELKLVPDHEGSLPTLTSRKNQTPQQQPLEPESISKPLKPSATAVNFARPGRTASPKELQAKDLNKREMTYDEKHKLSTNLQSLPPEKLEIIVEIIKKRNLSLCQQDDEIEVDIDTFDAETLWELDRFINKYKKSLSKNKKNAETADKVKAVDDHGVHDEHQAQAQVVVETLKKANTDRKDSSPTQGPMQGNDTSRSCSSSDSGSSSSDSESRSSSEYLIQ